MGCGSQGWPRDARRAARRDGKSTEGFSIGEHQRMV